MAEDRFTLFGFESPEQVRSRIGRAGIEQGMALARAPRGRGGVALAGSLGGLLGSIFDVNGEQKLAKTRSEAQQNAFTRSEGKPSEYYRYLAENLSAAEDARGAMAALEQYRKVQADEANAALAREKLEASKSKNERMYAAKIEALESRERIKEQDREIERLKVAIKDRAQQSEEGLNDAKIISLQKKVEDMEMQRAQDAERLRQADERVQIQRDRAATYAYDAKTRRMKLKADENIARIKEKGLAGKAANKMFKDSMDSYEKMAHSKELFEFSKRMVEDDPELGAFFADVDPDKMAALIRGSVMQKINTARNAYAQGTPVEFNYNKAIFDSIIDVTNEFTTMGANPVGIERAQEQFPTETKGKKIGRFSVVEE